jgi:hypothetical protein
LIGYTIDLFSKVKVEPLAGSLGKNKDGHTAAFFISTRQKKENIRLRTIEAAKKYPGKRLAGKEIHLL